MADDRQYDLRHHAARRRAGARVLDADPREGAPGAASSTRSASTSSRPGSRSRPTPTPRPSAVAARRAAARHRGAGPRVPRRHRAGRLGALRPPRAPRIHTFIATSDLHLDAQAPHDARGLPRRGRRRRPPGAPVHRRRAVLGRGRDAQRPRLPLPRRRGGHRARGDDDQPAGHGRLLDAGRDRASSSRPFIGRVPNADRAIFSTHCHNDLGLAVANSLAAVRGGVAAGRVHDQRHRRARRQRVARRSGDGDARPAGPPARTRPASTRTAFYATSQLLDRA